MLYFRAAQSIALHYGYDVINDPRELQVASEVTLECLAPTSSAGVETAGEVLGKMMTASSMTALREGLKKRTYKEMAQRGGAELFYVQLRALAHKVARKALDKAGAKNLEEHVLKRMLEQVGRRLPKEAGRRAVPVIGGAIGGLFDLSYMNKVLEGANLIYHKRFLFEKEHGVSLLMSGGGNTSI